MMRRIKQLLLALSLVGALGVATPTVASAVPLPATQFAAKCEAWILAFPAWYNGLECGENNAPQLNDIDQVWVIVLNVLQWLIVAAGYISIGFVIWGGIKYMKSQGEPGELAAAKNVILEACIGLGIVLAATALVQFVLTRIV